MTNTDYVFMFARFKVRHVVWTLTSPPGFGVVRRVAVVPLFVTFLPVVSVSFVHTSLSL